MEFLYFRPPLSLVTLTLLGNLATSLALRWPFRRDRWKKVHNLIFLNFLFFPAIVAIGVAGAVDPNPTLPPRPNVLAEWLSNSLFFVSIALGIYWIYRMKGLRWFGVSTVLLQTWLLMGAGFVVGMALTGDWL